MIKPRRRVASDNPAPASEAIDIASVTPRQPVVVRGEVMRMRLRPTGVLPTLAVSVRDSTGTLTAVWSGRRAIGGITLGRRIELRGVARSAGDHVEIMNPAYTLLAE